MSFCGRGRIGPPSHNRAVPEQSFRNLSVSDSREELGQSTQSSAGQNSSREGWGQSAQSSADQNISREGWGQSAQSSADENYSREEWGQSAQPSADQSYSREGWGQSAQSSADKNYSREGWDQSAQSSADQNYSGEKWGQSTQSSADQIYSREACGQSAQSSADKNYSRAHYDYRSSDSYTGRSTRYGASNFTTEVKRIPREPVLRCSRCEGKGHSVSQCPTPENFCENYAATRSGSRGFSSNSERVNDVSRSYPVINDWGQRNFSSNKLSRDASSMNIRNNHNNENLSGHNRRREQHSEIRNRRGQLASEDSQPNSENNPGPLRGTISVAEEDVKSRNNTGINFKRYDNIKVQVSNALYTRNILESFDDPRLHKDISSMLSRLKYETPTPVQKYAIPIIYAGCDLMACAQTGSGKTGAFMLPIINSIRINRAGSPKSQTVRPFALVLAPTRELVVQITKDAKTYALMTNLNVKECYGGTHIGDQKRNIRAGCDILIGTVGRVSDFLRSGFICLNQLDFLVFDEADRMLEMGFRETIQEIYETKMTGKRPQILMFSATFPLEVQQMAAQFLKTNHVKLDVGIVGSVSENICQTVIQVSDYSEKKTTLADILKRDIEMKKNAKILVFVNSKNSVQFLASFLSECGLQVTSIHGDRFQQQREEALQEFQQGVRQILVATSVAARGLDITGITHVINFDLPSNIEEYVHRVGRTGRLGNCGFATSFYDPLKNCGIAEALRHTLIDAGQEVPSFL